MQKGVMQSASASWRHIAVECGVEEEALDALSNASESTNRQRAKELGREQEPNAETTDVEVWVREHTRNGIKIDGHFRKSQNGK